MSRLDPAFSPVSPCHCRFFFQGCADRPIDPAFFSSSVRVRCNPVNFSPPVLLNLVPGVSPSCLPIPFLAGISEIFLFSPLLVGMSQF